MSNHPLARYQMVWLALDIINTETVTVKFSWSYLFSQGVFNCEMKYFKLSIGPVSNPNMIFSQMLFSVHTTGVGNVKAQHSLMFVYRLSQGVTMFPGKTQLPQRPPLLSLAILYIQCPTTTPLPDSLPPCSLDSSKLSFIHASFPRPVGRHPPSCDSVFLESVARMSVFSCC